MRNLHALAYTLIIIGALNWGFVGFFGFDIVAGIFGYMSGMSRLIYSLVGLSAIVEIVLGMRGYCFTKCAQN